MILISTHEGVTSPKKKTVFLLPNPKYIGLCQKSTDDTIRDLQFQSGLRYDNTRMRNIVLWNLVVTVLCSVVKKCWCCLKQRLDMPCLRLVHWCAILYKQSYIRRNIKCYAQSLMGASCWQLCLAWSGMAWMTQYCILCISPLQLLDEKKLQKTENLYLDFESPEKANRL
jgi:hypothetical protein